MYTPLVTVVIPCYNAAAYIADTLASVQAQTVAAWEALVVDDGSRDESTAIVAALAECDPRIKLVRAEHRGVSAARNLGVREARAEFIAFLDADDQWEPAKLAAHLIHLGSQPGVGVSFSRAAFMDGTGRLTGVISSAPTGQLDIRHFLYENPTTTTSSLFVRSGVFALAGGFDESMSYAEDLEWLARVVTRTHWKVAGLDPPLTRYRTNDAGLSARLDRMQEGWETLMAKMRVIAPEEVAQHYALAKAAHLRYLARRTVRLKAPPRDGCRYMRASLNASWRILMHQPGRTLATLAAVYARRAIHGLLPERI